MLYDAVLSADDVGVQDIVELRPTGPRYPDDTGPSDEDVAKQRGQLEAHGGPSL